MKDIFYILTFLILSITARTQEFGSPDSEWIYDYNGAWEKGITKVHFERDTTFDGRNIKIFKKQARRYSSLTGTTYSKDLKPVYLSSNNGITLFSEDGLHFDTLINFKAKIGQSWIIYHYFQSMIVDYVKLTVLDTFRMDILGNRIFAQAVQYKNPNWINLIDTVCEFIGGKWLYILPFDYPKVLADGGEGGIVRCFKNDLLGLVDFNNSQFGSRFQYDCNELTETKLASPNKSFLKIYSCEENNVYKVKSTMSKNAALDLINPYGQTIKQIIITPGDNYIDLSNLIPGMYIFLFNGIAFEKLLIK